MVKTFVVQNGAVIGMTAYMIGNENGSTVPGYTYAVRSDKVTDVLTERKSDIIVMYNVAISSPLGQSFAQLYYRRYKCFRWNWVRNVPSTWHTSHRSFAVSGTLKQQMKIVHMIASGWNKVFAVIVALTVCVDSLLFSASSKLFCRQWHYYTWNQNLFTYMVFNTPTSTYRVVFFR